MSDVNTAYAPRAIPRLTSRGLHLTGFARRKRDVLDEFTVREALELIARCESELAEAIDQKLCDAAESMP